MSRLCVKSLPKYITEERLKEFFSRKGEVTDAKLMRTKDGKSRQFGFVGFRTEHEAEAAIKYFNNSYMDTCRITCEIAQKVGDPNAPRPWSRHSLKKQESSSVIEKKVTGPKSSKTVLSKGGSKKSMKADIEENDPLFQEFINVMQNGKSKLWGNDTVADPSKREQSKVASKNRSQMENASEDNVDGEDAELQDTKKEKNEFSKKREADKPKHLVQDDVLTDADYFKSRIKEKWSDSDSSDEEFEAAGTGNNDADDDSDVSNDSQGKTNHGPIDDTLDSNISKEVADDGIFRDPGRFNPIDPGSPKNEEVLETSRLFIRNLPYTATEEEIEDHFRKYGKISQVHIVVDKDTKRSKGFAYVLFALPESAARALEEMDNSIFQGRLLHVIPAKQKNIPENNVSSEHSLKTFKDKRNAERKASEASGSTRAWNTLYMRPDTVAENIARKFGVSKAEILDRESVDLPAQMALWEAQVIDETMKALSRAGVNIASLEEFAAGNTDGLKRSNHIILVKNLPYSSSERELVELFGKFGSLDKVILPPVKTLALVIFLEPSEARIAFKSLSYRRYKDAPLYLEWAPDNILSQTPITDDNTSVGDLDVKKTLLQHQIDDVIDVDVDHDRIESRSLYVKNLNFRTSDADVKKHFSEHVKGGKILSVKVHKHMKNGKNVSKGFGFLEFDSVDTAVSVCKDLQGTVLDGHALILQRCQAKKADELPKKDENDRSSTKLIVRNVAFEATEKDLKLLFSPFGQIKSLRLPMRFGNHRGFAFVEYLTKQEARNALQALSKTHLYGRHLVLERAKEGESLEELRARTAAQFSESTKLPNKRKQFTDLDEGNVKFNRISD